MQPISKLKGIRFRWHGTWALNKKTGVADCESLIAYQELAPSEYFRLVCGRGGVVYEDFYVRLKGYEIERCVIDETDCITGKHVSWKWLLKRHLGPILRTDETFDEFHWHDGWWQADRQVLKPSVIEDKGLLANIALSSPGSIGDSDYVTLVGGDASATWIAHVMGEIGLDAPTVRALNLDRISKLERKAAHLQACKWIPKLARQAVNLEKTWSDIKHRL